MRTGAKKTTPAFKVGDRVTCVRGYAVGAVLTGTRWTVTSVGKTTIGIMSEHIASHQAPGVWPAVRFALAPVSKAEDKPACVYVHDNTECEICGGSEGCHFVWCDGAWFRVDACWRAPR